MLKNNKKFITTILGTALAAVLSVVCSSSVSAASNRLWGQDRYETSAAIAKDGWTSSDCVIVASGEGYADALCAVPVAKKYNAPILLTESAALNQNTKNEIKNLNAKHIIIIGKYASVSQGAENELKAIAGDVKRLGGNDRYETSVVVARELGTIDKVVVTSGSGFADALSIAPIAAAENMPILLSERDALPEVVRNYINENKANIKNSYIVGGQGIISNVAAGEISKDVVRLSGKDRFETNLNIMKSFKDKLNFEKIYVVQGDGPTGNEFADALSGAALASKTSSPIVLTYKMLSPDIRSFIKENAVNKTSITTLGGTAAVSQDLVTTLENAISSNVPTNVQTTPAACGSTGGSSSGSSTDKELSTIADKLKPIIPTLNTQNEKDVAEKIMDSINKVLKDPSYNYKDDVTLTKKLYSSLSFAEKDDLKSKILKNVDLKRLLQLKAKFGI